MCVERKRDKERVYVSRDRERESECREIEKVFVEGKRDKERVCVES